MSLDQTLSILRAHQQELRRLGVVHAAVFGSVSRREDSPASDVDLVVDLDRTVVRSALDRVGLVHALQDLLERRVDLVSRPIRRPRLRDRIERDAVVAF